VCTAYFRGFVASEAILKCSRWQIFWQGFLQQLRKLPKEPTVAVLMIWYAAPIAIKNSNGYSPFLFTTCLPKIKISRRSAGAHRHKCRCAILSVYRTKQSPSCLAKPPCHNFCITVLHTGVAKAPACNQLLIYTPCPCVVPIIPLPGTPPSGFASRHVEQWFHRRTDKLCYQSQMFTLQRVSRVVYIKRVFNIDNSDHLS
jgi:hypothetical protein